MCFSGTALRCMPGRSHSPGRGPGLTESASALRTSDAGLLPESLCRKRCGRRMQDCCRSRCAGSVAGLTLFSGRHELILMATCNERFCIGLFWMYEQDRIGEIGKRADAPRRWSAWRWLSAFLQPHFGGSCACHRCHGVGEPTPC